MSSMSQAVADRRAWTRRMRNPLAGVRQRMSPALLGGLCLLLFAPRLQAADSAGASAPAPAATDPAARALRQIMADDDAAQAEVDQWILDGRHPPGELKSRIEERFAPVRKAYETFLERHPKNVPGLLAFGSFLEDAQDDVGAAMQWEKARELAPKNPVPWNNLAGHYVVHGPARRAFEYYRRAADLKPDEPAYWRSLGNALLTLRAEAANYYQISEQAVLVRALGYLEKARKLDPKNFPLATELAQVYYGLQPPRPAEALQAWQDALALAGDDLERQGVHLHLARVLLSAGRRDEARPHFEAVTHTNYAGLKEQLLLQLGPARPATNAPAGAP